MNSHWQDCEVKLTYDTVGVILQRFSKWAKTGNHQLQLWGNQCLYSPPHRISITSIPKQPDFSFWTGYKIKGKKKINLKKERFFFLSFFLLFFYVRVNSKYFFKKLILHKKKKFFLQLKKKKKSALLGHILKIGKFIRE